MKHKSTSDISFDSTELTHVNSCFAWIKVIGTINYIYTTKEILKMAAGKVGELAVPHSETGYTRGQ